MMRRELSPQIPQKDGLRNLWANLLRSLWATRSGTRSTGVFLSPTAPRLLDNAHTGWSTTDDRTGNSSGAGPAAAGSGRWAGPVLAAAPRVQHHRPARRAF